MMTNMTYLEEQVSIIAKTLEELIKSMKEREAARDAQIAFMMKKIENVSGSNHTDGSPKPKFHREEAKSSKKGEN